MVSKVSCAMAVGVSQSLWAMRPQTLCACETPCVEAFEGAGDPKFPGEPDFQSPLRIIAVLELAP